MRVEDAIQRERRSRESRASLRLIIFLAWITCAGAALAEPTSAPTYVVPPAEQTARDSDRIEILRQELKKSESLLDAMARRKAERLAASDPVGVTVAEEQHTRVISDIVALKRELGAVSRAAGPASAEQVPATSAKPAASPRAPLTKAAATTPWWDVYGKGRRADPATPVSLAPVPDAAARPVTARRLE